MIYANNCYMSEAPVFKIPIEPEIAQFAQHLRMHSRTILSAKFGDGKSYFLDGVEKDKDVAAEYKFIKVYPVNYQVASNTDIFTLLKYDILLQLLVNEMVSDKSLSGSFVGLEDGVNFLTAFLEGVVEVEPTPNAKLTASFLPLLKEVVKLTEKRRIWKGGKCSARTLIKKIEKSQFLYFEDAATKLIRQSLQEWRARNQKKVVLVVEDLDRMDPAHLFRILNVFSAHMDFIYRNGEAPGESLVGSRFGFDSVVFVLEYENLKRLFNHFYGNEVSFSGYINKFIPQGYFEYSLRKSANSYFYESISRITGMDQAHISDLLDSVINYVSLRDMANAVKDVDSQVTLKQKEDLNIGFLLMLVIMRRVGMSVFQIVQSCEAQYNNNPVQFVRYMIDFMNLDGFSDKKGYIKVGNLTMYYIVGRNQDGFADIGRETPVPDQMKTFNMRVFIGKLMAYIIK